MISSIEAAFARLEISNAADDLATRETLRNEGIEIVVPAESEANAWRDVGRRTVERMQKQGSISAEILAALNQAKSAPGSR